MRGWRKFALVIFGQNARKCLQLQFQQVELVKPTGLIDFKFVGTCPPTKTPTQNLKI